MPEFEIDDAVRRKQRETIKNRSASSLESKYAAQNRQDLEEAEAAMAPPVITIPQCHTCQHPKRFWIERQLLKGRSYSAISANLEQDPSSTNVDRRSIAVHAKSHMPLDQAVIRAVLEEEADLVGQGWEEGVRGAFTNRGALNTLIRKAYEDAMGGVTTVEPRDLIQMIKLYTDMDASASNVATEEAKVAVRIFMESIHNVFADMLEPELADELKQAIAAEVKRLRTRDEIDIEVERNLRVIPSTT